MNLSCIEQAIKELIIAQKWPWLSQLNVRTYAGEFDDGLEAVVRSFPAIWITFNGGGKPEVQGYGTTKMPVSFMVMVGARSVRNEESQRHGSAFDVGTYQMIDSLQRLLAFNSLSSVGLIGLEPIQLGRVKPIFNTSTQGKSVSVLGLEINTSYTIKASDRTRDDADPTIADIHSINLDYIVPPADANAEASDIVLLKDN